MLSNYTNIASFTIHLADLIVDFLIDINVVVVVEVLDVLIVDSIIFPVTIHLFLLLSLLYWQLLYTAASFDCMFCKSCCHQIL